MSKITEHTSEPDLPLVSCIMPTADRRPFVPRAVRQFLAQDYPNKELVILDDGADGVADLVPDDPRVRYLRHAGRMPLGTKRNDCVRASRGELIMHWDDDDWMAPRRIRCQVEALLASGAEVCGLRRALFHDPGTGRTWLYEYPAGARPWLIGGTLLYRLDFWRRAPFPAVNAGEDTRFLWAHALERVAEPDDFTFYVALIHPGNTSPKLPQGDYWSAWPGDVAQLMGDTGAPPPAPAPSPGGRTVMRLNLGCRDARLPDHVNVDGVPGPGVEVVDLREPWPWADSSVDAVRAADIVEHLPDKIRTMNELWRVLKPGGTAEITVPTTDGSGAFQDPTHVSFWNRRSFLYYEDGSPYHEQRAGPYGITARFRVVREHTERTADGPRLTIVLEAVKA
jgi:hypothetical protein